MRFHKQPLVRKHVCLAAIVMGMLAVTACNSPARDVLTLPTAPTSTVPMGTDFTLAPGESVVVNSGEMTLTFVGLTSESRCPINALISCVWEGSATINVRARTESRTREFPLETVRTRDTETVDRYVVQLVAVTPAPLTLDPIPPASYRATLRMVRKN